MGESLSGDAVVAVEVGDRFLLAIIDALGHGPFASGVAQKVVAYFESFSGEDLEAAVRDVDGMLRSGGSASGAALGVAFVEQSGEVRYVGVGNTVARIVSAGGEQRQLVSKDGTAGQIMPTPAEQGARLHRGELLVLTTDGIQSRLGRDTERSQIFAGSAYNIAVGVVRLYGKDYDDAACLVYRHG